LYLIAGIACGACELACTRTDPPLGPPKGTDGLIAGPHHKRHGIELFILSRDLCHRGLLEYVILTLHPASISFELSNSGGLALSWCAFRRDSKMVEGPLERAPHKAMWP